MSQNYSNQSGLLVFMNGAQGIAVKKNSNALEPGAALELERQHTIARHVVFCNKNLKGIQQELQEMKPGAAKSIRELYKRHNQFHRSAYEKHIDLLLGYDVREFLKKPGDILKLNDRRREES